MSKLDVAELFNSGAKRDEVIVFEYDNIIQMFEPFILKEFLLSEYDKFNELIQLDVFAGQNEKSVLPIICKRNEKNIFKWLARNKENNTDKDYEGLYNSLYSLRKDMMDCSELTSIGMSLPMLAGYEFINIKILTNGDERKIKTIQDIFHEQLTLLENKVEIIKDNCSTEQYLESIEHNYTTLFTDDQSLVDRLIKPGRFLDKTFIMPYMGYHFVENNGYLVSHHELEIKAGMEAFGFGFIEPFKFTEEHYSNNVG